VVLKLFAAIIFFSLFTIVTTVVIKRRSFAIDKKLLLLLVIKCLAVALIGLTKANIKNVKKYYLVSSIK
jgi:hypothetical protein